MTDTKIRGPVGRGGRSRVAAPDMGLEFAGSHHPSLQRTPVIQQSIPVMNSFTSVSNHIDSSGNCLLGLDVDNANILSDPFDEQQFDGLYAADIPSREDFPTTECPVKISDHRRAVEFSVQLDSEESDLLDFMAKLKEFYTDTALEQLQIRYKKNMACVAITREGVWERAIIKEMPHRTEDRKQFYLHFVDTGKKCWIDDNWLRPLLPEFAQKPPFAILCRCIGIVTDDLNTVESRFQSIIARCNGRMRCRFKTNSEPCQVHLYDNDGLITDKLLPLPAAEHNINPFKLTQEQKDQISAMYQGRERQYYESIKMVSDYAADIGATVEVEIDTDGAVGGAVSGADRLREGSGVVKKVVEDEAMLFADHSKLTIYIVSGTTACPSADQYSISHTDQKLDLTKFFVPGDAVHYTARLMNERWVATKVSRVDLGPVVRKPLFKTRVPTGAGRTRMEGDILNLPVINSDVWGYAIVTTPMEFHGYLSSSQHGEIRFERSALLIDSNDEGKEYGVHQLLESGQSVYFNANRAPYGGGPNKCEWNAIRVVPLGPISESIGFVYKLMEGYGYLSCPTKGYVFFPYSSLMSHCDYSPPLKDWLGRTVHCRITHEIPGYKLPWRATLVKLVEGQEHEERMSGPYNDEGIIRRDKENRRYGPTYPTKKAKQSYGEELLHLIEISDTCALPPLPLNTKDATTQTAPSDDDQLVHPPHSSITHDVQQLPVQRNGFNKDTSRILSQIKSSHEALNAYNKLREFIPDLDAIIFGAEILLKNVDHSGANHKP